MSRRLPVNLLLLALAAGLWWVAARSPAPEGKPPPRPFSDIDPGAVRSILIERPAGEPLLEIGRRGSHWWITRPFTAPADRARVGRLLSITDEPAARIFSPEGVDLRQTGLAPPRAVLLLDGERIEFGASNPLNRHRYLRRGEAVYLCLDREYYLLASTPESWVDHALLPPGAPVSSISLPTVRYNNRDGEWTLGDGSPAPGGKALLEAWRGARARAVSRRSEVPPSEEVEIRLARGERLRYRILRPAGQLELCRPGSGLCYRLDPALETTLFPANEGG